MFFHLMAVLTAYERRNHSSDKPLTGEINGRSARMAFRNLERRPWRASVTALGSRWPPESRLFLEHCATVLSI